MGEGDGGQAVTAQYLGSHLKDQTSSQGAGVPPGGGDRCLGPSPEWTEQSRARGFLGGEIPGAIAWGGTLDTLATARPGQVTWGGGLRCP